VFVFNGNKERDLLSEVLDDGFAVGMINAELTWNQKLSLEREDAKELVSLAFIMKKLLLNN